MNGIQATNSSSPAILPDEKQYTSAEVDASISLANLFQVQVGPSLQPSSGSTAKLNHMKLISKNCSAEEIVPRLFEDSVRLRFFGSGSTFTAGQCVCKLLDELGDKPAIVSIQFGKKRPKRWERIDAQGVTTCYNRFLQPNIQMESRVLLRLPQKPGYYVPARLIKTEQGGTLGFELEGFNKVKLQGFHRTVRNAIYKILPIRLDDTLADLPGRTEISLTFENQTKATGIAYNLYKP